MLLWLLLALAPLIALAVLSTIVTARRSRRSAADWSATPHLDWEREREANLEKIGFDGRQGNGF